MPESRLDILLEVEDKASATLSKVGGGLSRLGLLAGGAAAAGVAALGAGILGLGAASLRQAHARVVRR